MSQATLAVMGFLLIIIFVAVLMTKKVSPFVGLICVPILFGIIIAAANVEAGTGFMDAFESVVGSISTWIREGLLYSLNKETVKVTGGTIGTALLLLFAIIYFSIMLVTGMFDAMCIALIKLVKGDPLKITMATCLLASIVALDGDGTTTVLIVTAATLTLFKKMDMKMIYLAMLIVIPNSILNFMPWGGPLGRVIGVLTPLQAEVESQLFVILIPCIIGGMVWAFIMAYIMGIKERKRLGFIKGQKDVISQSDIDGIIEEIKNRDKDLKRPKLFWFNLIMSILIMYLLIAGIATGWVLFMIGTAIALLVNFPKLKDQAKIISENGGDALGPVVVVMAAGVLMGVLNGTGMSNAIATTMASWVPASLGSHIPFLFSIIALPGLVFLSNDAFYFGILPVITPIAMEYGSTAMQMGVAAMLGQALHFASPLVAFIYILIDRCDISFGEYQKEFVKWAWPIFVVYVAMAVVTGAMPL